MDPKPTVLFDFTKARDIERWHVFSDAFFGGRSQAEWRAAQDQVRAALTLAHCLCSTRRAQRRVNSAGCQPLHLGLTEPPASPRAAPCPLSPPAIQSAAEFSGRCSTELPEDADILRAGYCAATSKVRTRMHSLQQLKDLLETCSSKGLCRLFR